MELFILGSGTCIPTADRGPSGLALSFASHLIFFDGGGGSLRPLPRLGLDYRRIDFHCITHFHPDHVTDLVPFLFALNYSVDFSRSLPLHIVGPAGLEEILEKLSGIFGRWIEAKTYERFLHEVRETRLNFSDFSLETLPLNHSESAVGFRVNAEGRSMVYSGDTGYCEEIVRLGKGADLLVLECSLPEERKVPGHLTPALAGRIARESSCRKLLLTHFYPVFEGHDIREECGKEFRGEILLAVDGLTLRI